MKKTSALLKMLGLLILAVFFVIKYTIYDVPVLPSILIGIIAIILIFASYFTEKFNEKQSNMEDSDTESSE